MCEDLQNNQLLLQQVETLLVTHPENQELQQLKNELQEVIKLASDLTKAETTASTGNNLKNKSVSKYIKPTSSMDKLNIKNTSITQEVIKLPSDLTKTETTASTGNNLKNKSVYKYVKPTSSVDKPNMNTSIKPFPSEGSWCKARMVAGGYYYKAKIDKINSNGQVNITYEFNHKKGVTRLSDLCEWKPKKKDKKYYWQCKQTS